MKLTLIRNILTVAVVIYLLTAVGALSGELKLLLQALAFLFSLIFLGNKNKIGWYGFIIYFFIGIFNATLPIHLLSNLIFASIPIFFLNKWSKEK